MVAQEIYLFKLTNFLFKTLLGMLIILGVYLLMKVCNLDLQTQPKLPPQLQALQSQEQPLLQHTLIQDGTGGRTLSLGTDYETAGGAGITLTATASATDIVPYVVSAAGRILLGAPQLAFS